MNIFGMTDIGQVRSENQDSYTVRQLREDVAVAVVCDGMGGARAGNVASAIAVETFAAAVEELCREEVPQGERCCAQVLRDACLHANTQVHQLSRSEELYRGMGTTLVAALLVGQDAYVINVGDSRCYHIHGNAIDQVTNDHSLVQLLVNRGDISPQEARNHPKKNLITRALGVDRDVLSDCYHVAMQPGEGLLLCSDGLSNVLADETLLQLAQETLPLEERCRNMMRMTLEQGAPDNVTIVMAQL